jgi:catechol 2,3-dioxygenase-like lactoylglutathione lyase family enzyme
MSGDALQPECGDVRRPVRLPDIAFEASASRIVHHVEESRMSINLQTPGVHHVSLRVSDLARAKRFYAETLGFPVVLDTPDVFLFAAGGTVFGLRGPSADTPPGDRFNPCRVGLDHIALGCTEDGELERAADALLAAGIENTGVRLDATLGKRYVAFKDPDRIAWEFYVG